MPSIEPDIPCEKRALFLVVIVNSGADEGVHRSLRSSIRKTWGNSTATPGNTNTWRLFFALGDTANVVWNRENRREASQFNDVIIGHFMDSYKNMIVKTLMGHLWAFSRFSCQYVLKSDDDVYIRIPRLSYWLSQAGRPRRFYGGLLNEGDRPHRDPKSK
ncbi:hypothetical protein QZH41_003493 [Actinostola sp. cb2023]|nr:hypothetical protein QZH41_003493 [Actinostola sp. cb2023]